MKRLVFLLLSLLTAVFIFVGCNNSIPPEETVEELFNISLDKILLYAMYPYDYALEKEFQDVEISEEPFDYNGYQNLYSTNLDYNEFVNKYKEFFTADMLKGFLAFFYNVDGYLCISYTTDEVYDVEIDNVAISYDDFDGESYKYSVTYNYSKNGDIIRECVGDLYIIEENNDYKISSSSVLNDLLMFTRS